MEHRRYQHKAIEICRDCKGTGDKVIYAPDDYKEDNPILIQCATCLGSGRVWVSKKTVITVDPYKQ